jgi:hypothetical protein
VHAAIRTARYWLPIVGCLVCLVVTLFVGPVAGWLLLTLAFGLLLDGCTAMWERAGGTGNLTTYKQ